MGRDTRALKVGEVIQFQVIVRDRLGIQQLTRVNGLDVTSSNPAALAITPITTAQHRITATSSR